MPFGLCNAPATFQRWWFTKSVCHLRKAAADPAKVVAVRDFPTQYSSEDFAFVPWSCCLLSAIHPFVFQYCRTPAWSHEERS